MTNLKPTRKDPANQHSKDALDFLGQALELRQERVRRVRQATKKFGWKGPLISGVEQEHWPTSVKDQLRTNARQITEATDNAFACWARAGRRFGSLRPLLDDYRVIGSRY